MPARALEAKRWFHSDDRGTVAVIFGLIAVVFTFAAGLGVDVARIVHTKSRLAAAIDAAALAAGRALLEGRLTDAQVIARAQLFVNENIKGGGDLFGTLASVDVSLDRTAGRVTIDVKAEVPMTLTAVAGIDAVDLPVSTVANFEQKDLELGIALDVTGSMAGTKIDDLKLAAKDLIDILLPDGGTSNKIRIGLAPYAAGVNAGSYAGPATNGRSTNGCVHERGGSEAFTDAKPATGAYLGFKKGMACPSAKVRPMTDKKDVLKGDIEAYTASGGTAGHLGAAWAWYLVSPKWATFWPSDSAPVEYQDPKTDKIVILMTDGEFNTQYVDANGSSATQARQLCAKMKGPDPAKPDVIVYSVAFMSPPAAEALLKECASPGEHFFIASNGGALRDAFRKIATSINNLRLTN
ncbi:MAG TPA: pilus assembly protein TadG-related protein [Alphaproteobacteria bacterium]|nr:pilus assembly protein TadG-related protein [Alphaproteobacteria bacterium]